MNFEFSDEQRQLHDAVERYLGDQYGFDRYQSIKGSAAGWDPSVWRGLADLGVLAITVPTARAPREPSVAAMSPYVITRPGGMARTISRT